jgi:hypothetical protein
MCVIGDGPTTRSTTGLSGDPMNETFARRLTSLAGIAATAALIIEVPLYFIYSGPPPDANVLTRLLRDLLAGVPDRVRDGLP